jgi:hypothetical protein
MPDQHPYEQLEDMRQWFDEEESDEFTCHWFDRNVEPAPPVSRRKILSLICAAIVCLTLWAFIGWFVYEVAK